MAQPHLATVVEIKEQTMVAVTQINWLEDEDVHRVLDQAPGVDRR